MVPPPLWPPRYRLLSLKNYHIRDGWGYGIIEALQVAQIGDFNIMVLTETNITGHVYRLNSIGYDVV